MENEKNQNNQIPPPAPSDGVAPSQSSSTEVHEPKPKIHIPWPKILAAGIVILITLLAFGIIAYLMMGQNKSEEGQFEEVVVAQPTPNPDITADWNIYKGDGFTFSYPNDWSQYDDDVDTIIKTVETEAEATGDYTPGWAEIRANPISNTPKEINAKQSEFSQVQNTTEEVVANNYDALKLTGYTGVSSSVYFHVFVIENETGNSVLISLITQDENLKNEFIKDFEQILSTFKFTDVESTADTSNWKTYTNNEFGFSFNYPDSEIEIKPYQPGNESIFITNALENKNKFTIKVVKNVPEEAAESSFFDNLPNGTKNINNITWNTYYLPNGYGDGGSQIKPLPIYGLQTYKNGTTYAFYVTGQSELNQIQDQILSTFQITK